MVSDGDIAQGNSDQTGDPSFFVSSGIARCNLAVLPKMGPKHFKATNNAVFL
jgi:hypothetical protein